VRKGSSTAREPDAAPEACIGPISIAPAAALAVAVEKSNPKRSAGMTPILNRNLLTNIRNKRIRIPPPTTATSCSQLITKRTKS